MQQAGHGQNTRSIVNRIAMLEMLEERDFYHAEHTEIYGRIVDRRPLPPNLRIDPVRDQPARAAERGPRLAAYPHARPDVPGPAWSCHRNCREGRPSSWS
jgi:hypothetical protein